MNEKILLALPTFNNEITLKEVISESQKFINDILIINDGSKDKTKLILNEFKNINIINHIDNLGKGEAIKNAFDFAIKNNFSHVISMDTDGQHLPESLACFINEIKKNPDSLIIGDRIFTHNKNIPLSSKFGRKFSNLWIYLETGKLLKDTQSGFRAYPIKYLNNIDLKTSRYDFEIEVLVKYLWNNAPVKSINIPVIYQYKNLRVSHFKPILDNYYLTKLHSYLVAKRVLNIFNKNEKERNGAKLIPFFLKYIGVSCCYKMSYFIVLYYFITNQRSLSAIIYFYKLLNLNNSINLLKNAYKNYLYFSASLIDRIALSEGHKNFNVIKKNNFNIDPSEPLILIGSHFGDWTISSILFKNKTDKKVAIVMNENSTKIFHKIIKDKKVFNNVTIINSDQDHINVILEIKELIKENAIICFLCDRIIENIAVEKVTFLNKEFQIASGPFAIAKIFNCKVVAFFSLKTRFHYKGDYDLYCYTLKEKNEKISINDLIQNYIKILEKLIYKYPENWFNFNNLWRN